MTPAVLESFYCVNWFATWADSPQISNLTMRAYWKRLENNQLVGSCGVVGQDYWESWRSEVQTFESRTPFVFFFQHMNRALEWSRQYASTSSLWMRWHQDRSVAFCLTRQTSTQSRVDRSMMKDSWSRSVMRSSFIKYRFHLYFVSEELNKEFSHKKSLIHLFLI